MEEINQSNDEFDKQNFTHRLTSLTGFKLNEFEKKPQTKSVYKKPVFKNALEGRKTAERLVLSSMLVSPEAINIFIEQLGYLIDDDCQILAMSIIDEHRKGNPIKIADILDLVKEQKQKDLLLEISSNEIYKEEYNEENFISYIYRIKKWTIEDSNENLKKLILNETDPNTKQELMIKYTENINELRRYNIEKDNNIDE